MLQQISSGSVKTISLNRDELWARLRAIAHQIRTAHSNVQDVRVFGSIARGDHVGTSDVDLLIILANTPEQNSPADRIARSLPFYRYFDLPIGVDLLVCTASELERKTPFLSRIYAESIPL